MKQVIHVNPHVIKANRNLLPEERRNPITVKNYKEDRQASEVVINGPCHIIYRPDDPLPCGATVWIETEAEITALT